MTGILQQIMSTMEQTRSVSVLDSVSMIGFAALLVLGVINCVLGYRLLRFWMMLFGFLIGGGIGLGVAYTMGIQTIMRSKKILIIANGEGKADIVRDAFFGPITPMVPASVLQLHNDVTLVADEAALSKIPASFV